MSIAGLSETQIRDYDLTREGYIIQQPIMAAKENIPYNVSSHEIVPTTKTEEGGDSTSASPLKTETYDLIHKDNIVVYKSHDGQWSKDLPEVQKNYPWMTGTLPTLSRNSQPGFYFLGQRSDNSYVWIPADNEVQVICPTNRGLYGVREELIDISSQLYGLLEFFEQSQVPPNENDTNIDPSFFTCRVGLQNSRVPRVLLLALRDAMTELYQNEQVCNAVMRQLFDALDFLSIKREPRKKERSERIKPFLEREKRDIFNLIAPSEDYGPVYDVLVKLRDNLIFNHNNLANHAIRMRSLEKETLTDQEHLQLLGTLHNLDVFARDIIKASIRNLENLRYVNSVMRDALKELQEEAVLLANSVHYDASCFSHRYRNIQCAKDVPRVNFTAEGKLIIEYFSESIVLESRKFYTCLPTKYGLSWKHRHYSIQHSGSSILLNSGKLILNDTARESFAEEYKNDLATVEQCYFNPRPQDHVYMNCEIETPVQYKSDKGRMEVIILQPFELWRVEFSQFPITIRTFSLQLKDIQDKQDNVLLDNMYGRVTREAWISALHLPRALMEHRERTKANEYWADVTKLSIKYPKLRYYFTFSMAVMSLTGVGLVAACMMKYRVNIFNCCFYLYGCCRPKRPDELKRSPLPRKRAILKNSKETEVKRTVRELESGTRGRRGSRSRSRSRSRSKRRRGSVSRSPLPNYNEVTAPPEIRDSSTQVRDRYSVAYKK